MLMSVKPFFDVVKVDFSWHFSQDELPAKEIFQSAGIDVHEGLLADVQKYNSAQTQSHHVPTIAPFKLGKKELSKTFVGLITKH